MPDVRQESGRVEAVPHARSVARRRHLAAVPELGDARRRVGLPTSTVVITEIPTPASWLTDLGDFIAWQRAAGRPDTTVKIRSYHLRRFAVQAALPPREVETDLMVEHLGNPRWGAHTRRSVRSTLRAFYTWLHVTGRMSHNPAAMLPQVSTPPGRPRPAADEAVQRGRAAVDARSAFMVDLAARTGMRCCELAVVHRDDVIGPRGRRSLVVHGKGGKERVVPISDDLAHRILEHEGYVFPGQIDGHLSSAYVSKLLSRALAGLATGHQLRHRYATDSLRRAGGNLRVVQELLGHSSVATTQVYTAVDDDELRRAAAA
jgi:integrase/recombinase XerC